MSVSGWMFLLVPAHPGCPGQIPQSRKTVVCVCVQMQRVCMTCLFSQNTKSYLQAHSRSQIVMLKVNGSQLFNRPYMISYVSLAPLSRYLYLPSEWSETGGYTVFTFVCLSVLTQSINRLCTGQWSPWRHRCTACCGKSILHDITVTFLYISPKNPTLILNLTISSESQ